MNFIQNIFRFESYPSQVINKPNTWKWFIGICILIRMLFFISDGHNSDFDFFENWADRIVHHGLLNIYSIKVDRFECDYPPLYLYIITPIAHLFDAFSWDMHTQFFDSFLKFFNLIVEFSFLFFFYRKTKNKIFIALMLLSPATIVNAYGWGQIDILYSILMFLGIYYILENKLYPTAIILGISLCLKTQTLLFLPIFGLLFLISKNSLKEKLFSIVLLFCIFIVLHLPFLLGAPNPMDSINPHLTAAGRYNFISVNAFNFYWTLWADFGLKIQLKFPPNDVLIFGLISRKVLAYSLFAIAFTWILINIKKHHPSKPKVIALLSLFCFTYFMLLPEMHERYLFPMFIFSAYLTSFDKREWPYFLIIVLLHSVNLVWAWGEQKFIKVQWLFEISRIFALLTTVMWVLYVNRIRKFLNE